MSARPILELFPALERRVSLVSIGSFPSPIDACAELAPGLDAGAAALFVKRDDLSSPLYGGNKVRTLEGLFGEARRRGCGRIYAVGAYGSNHAVATALHAPSAGLEPALVLFPQPSSLTARENLRVSATRVRALVDVRHWSLLPAALWRLGREARRNEVSAMVMPPGGANVIGAIGYVSAALEVAQQVASDIMPAPSRVVLAVGSTCTSAGLLLGFHLASRLGLGFVADPKGGGAPVVHSVRVTPWPITSAWRIVSLARRTGAFLYEITKDARFLFGRRELLRGLTVDGSYLGRGYACITPTGLQAIDAFGAFGARALDTTYSAKAAAAALDIARRSSTPVLFWATKSSAPLPLVAEGAIERIPSRMQTWLSAGEGSRVHPLE